MNGILGHLPRKHNNIDLTLGQRLRRWSNVKSAPGQCVVFAGFVHIQAKLGQTRRKNWNQL